jgi:hypothetical protein
MMILAIAVSTMITVAIVVFSIQCYIYRKIIFKRDKICTRKGAVGVTQEVPIAS